MSWYSAHAGYRFELVDLTGSAVPGVYRSWVVREDGGPGSVMDIVMRHLAVIENRAEFAPTAWVA